MARLIRLASLALLCSAAFAAAPASGAVRLGPDTSVEPTGNTGCGADACTFVNRANPSAVLQAPSDGVITRWRIRISGMASTWRLRTVFEPMAGMWIATGSSASEVVQPDAERVFETRLAIKTGQSIGIDGVASAISPIALISIPGGANSRFNPPLVVGEAPRTATGNGGGFNGMFNADLERDADGDGFGDETQDECPTDAGTQGPCGFCRGRRATIAGTSGKDVIRGTAGRDVIVAFAGGDRVKALGGKDLVCGGKGPDVLKGGAGKDVLLGQKGRDRLIGQKGKDRALGGAGRDVCVGKADVRRSC